MALSPRNVKDIAYLARLGVDADKLENYASEISNILSLVEQMSLVDTSGVEPMAHPLHAVQKLRADNVSEADQREKLQYGAPAVEKGLFLVPKVIE